MWISHTHNRKSWMNKQIAVSNTHTLLEPSSNLQHLSIKSRATQKCYAEWQHTTIVLLPTQFLNRICPRRNSHTTQIQHIPTMRELAQDTILLDRIRQHLVYLPVRRRRWYNH